MSRVGDELIERAEVRERGVDQMRGGARFGEIRIGRRADRTVCFALARDGGETFARSVVGATRVQHQRER